ncbi:MAG: DUF1684 domain-containing protein [Salegentibacter sp.]|uniref:DUF1684 domain-containing protein n=1 Tax=Salegentibacter flavus TaxID=287099 RepID=A0A1I4ZEZ1_9FLAO|nr:MULTISPECIES: DUF1684 domain-containing protein [Salegentibacter]MDR9456782.1 DUF1684 domain-containing protein [Salegentibacter sp.]SFN48832.1 hypothetical protein SAMN05660413_01290 [Salegentibacter flavus]
MKFVVFSLFLVIFDLCIAQEKEYLAELQQHRKAIDLKFADEEESPLEENDLRDFKNLDYFEADPKFRLKAKFVRTPNTPLFAMPTTTLRLPLYRKYAEIYFSLNGKKYKLDCYQNQELISDPEYHDYLFLPFTDLTNGETTYSGGRYLDLRIPEGDSIILDFNKTYNPYCAYNGEYSCPVVPNENHLEIPVAAGVKKF